MSSRSLTRSTGMIPALFDDFFKPWNEWFDNGNVVRRTLNVPAVNITEDEQQYSIKVAAPGLQKKDFKIDVNGNMLTISAETEERKEEKDGKITRQEYNYTSFARSFTLPEDVNREAIDARYENGELHLMLPKREESKKAAATKQIAVK
jgi:HSP20 family protein